METIIKWGPPGTGKSYELRQALVEHGCKGALSTTFSRNSADKARFKTARKMDVDPEDLKHTINTIHGTCYRLLGGPAYAKVVDAKQIKEFNNETGYNFKISNDTPEPDNGSGVYDAYTWLYNTETPLEQVDDYPNFRKLKLAQSDVREQIKHYIEWKEHNGLIDFTDMLSIVLKSGLCPDVDLLLVDEFQDLTSLQYKIFLMWYKVIKDIGNVVVAGDPLQSIYGFMGGSPDHFHNLIGTKEVLPYSHRLSKPVWDYATAVAADVGMEVPNIETAPHEGKIKNMSYRDYVNDVAGWEGTPTHEVYHLVRSKYQAPAICKIMADNGIIWAGLGGWTDAQINLLNTINRVRNGEPLFKPNLKTLAYVCSGTMFNFMGSKDDLIKHIGTLENAELSGMQGGLVTPTLYNILKSEDPTSAMLNIGKTTQQKINMALPKHTTPLHLSNIKTSVMTIHAAKGLDAERVYLHTGISNNTKKAMRADPAAEGRVFYVGISRAKNELLIVKDKGANYPLPMGVS